MSDPPLRGGTRGADAAAAHNRVESVDSKCGVRSARARAKAQSPRGKGARKIFDLAGGDLRRTGGPSAEMFFRRSPGATARD